MAEFFPFPSIEGVRHLVPQSYKAFGESTTDVSLAFTGTVKLHGTHADLVWHRNAEGRQGTVTVQSRNRVLSGDADNNGCAAFFDARKAAVTALFERLVSNDEKIDTIVVAGEFCGRGVQSKVALCRLPQMFVVFAVKYGKHGRWIDTRGLDIEDAANRIYDVRRAPTYAVSVDMADPSPGLERMNALTAEVDRECPFAKTLGVSGPGEGIVWTCDRKPSCTRLWFKTKGNSHRTPVAAPKTNGVLQSAASTILDPMLTEERMQQGIAYLREMMLPVDKPSSIPAFCAWVVGDVIKEEGDVILEAGLREADTRKYVSITACAWFRNIISNLNGGGNGKPSGESMSEA